ncbi:MAG: peptide chain release factor N(5)-glutamine methyltransferase, partial [Clostridia bacterium]|nr:peptide chain release factor N(5)-glutamine methyltransferase [Clostridia bacterium]
IEGVMMRSTQNMALAVRDEMGEIRLETTRLPAKQPWYKKVPFLRGIINMVVSMIAGTKIITKSAEILVEEEIDTSNGKGMNAIMGISTVLGVALALCLFVLLPTGLTTGIFRLANLDTKDLNWVWLKSLLEGVFKMAILILYMWGVSRMKEIKRLFMYHGAEHKTIACFEAEMPLTVENVQKCSRYHDRCGTSFIVFVVVLSIILMMIFDIICAACNVTVFLGSEWKPMLFRTLLKIAFLPFVAGISYEMLMLLARSNFVLFRPLKWLGKQFQKLTTREPDNDMCEVAITSFNAVLAMDNDESIAEVKFPEPITLAEFKQRLAQSGIMEKIGEKDVNWLTCAVLNIKPQFVEKDDIKVPFGWTVRLDKMNERLDKGEPWQYVVGNVEFYKRMFTVNKDVLIPRQETELVCEQLVKRLNKKSSVLDLCCGSGVLGITAALETGANVTLADISADALKVAKYNAKRNKAKVDFVRSNMFDNLCGKCNAIVCNPPYIETDTIATLDDSVKKYEPHLALDGGKDGLDFYRILAEQAPKHLTKKGFMVLEIGYNQGEAVKNLLEPKFDVEVLKDYGGNDRIVIATKKLVKK